MSSEATAKRRSVESELPFVVSTVNYCADVPRASAYVVTPEKNYRPLVATTVKIRDARPIREQLDLETYGFALFDHKSSVTHLRSAEQIDGPYHKEVGKLISDISGADFVLPYRKYMQLRLSQRAPGESGNEFTRPASFVLAGRGAFAVWAVGKWVRNTPISQLRALCELPLGLLRIGLIRAFSRI